MQYQPYWALRAHLLTQTGDNSTAQQAYAQAIGLTEDSAIREFLMRKAEEAFHGTPAHKKVDPS